MFQLSNVQEYVTIGTCWSVYKAEMQNVKVVYFTESTIAVIAKYFTFLSTNKLSAGEYEIQMSGKCL